MKFDTFNFMDMVTFEEENNNGRFAEGVFFRQHKALYSEQYHTKPEEEK